MPTAASSGTRRRRPSDVVGAILVAALAAGLVVLAVDGFTTDDADPARDVAETQSGEVASPISGFSFESVTIAVGATVTWVNEDPAPHTVTAADGSFDSGVNDPLQQGEAFRAQFVAPGEYTVICSIHPDMVGQVTVVSDGA